MIIEQFSIPVISFLHSIKHELASSILCPLSTNESIQTMQTEWDSLIISLTIALICKYTIAVY